MKNILIVDDDLHIGNVIEEILIKEDTVFFVLTLEQKRYL